MCGILGWLSKPDLGDSQRFGAALDLLNHRGPDDGGTFTDRGVLLGHRRLSIIDLTAAGHQPMIDPVTGATIVFNGEIYNYVELRDQLRQKGRSFSTATDTEVLLQAFLEWGAAALTKLNGMWAFAIWLPAERKLFFARDRFGVKPFYYATGKHGFAFASEPKALLKILPENRAVNEQALFNFLEEGRLYADTQSFYRGIDVLLPAHCGEFDLNVDKMHIWRYWDYPHSSEPVAGFGDEAVEEFAALLDDSVRLRLRSDVPVGFTLSGGLDSTALLASSTRSSEGTRVCFTSVYGGTERGESRWAATAAEPYGITPIEVEAPKENWLETLDKIAWHMDGPGYSPAVYPLWFLMQDARKRGIPVLLEGQGADEALGGYPQYAVIDFIQQFHAALARPGKLSILVHNWRKLNGTFTRRWVALWMLRETLPFLVSANRRRVGAGTTLRPEFVRHDAGDRCDEPVPAGMDQVTGRLWLDHSRSILPGLLHYGDAISMAHGIESRLPFMDYRLVEWLFSRGAGLKIRDGETKWVLREYLRRNGQARIGNRADKQGYPTPIERWLAKDGGALAKEILLSHGTHLHEFCDPARIGRLINQHLAGKSGAGHHVYRLVSTELWLRRCISG